MFIKAIEPFLERQIWVVHCSLSISIIWGTAIMSMSNIGDFATNSLLVYWRWEFQIWNTISLMSVCAQHGQMLTTHDICCKSVIQYWLVLYTMVYTIWHWVLSRRGKQMPLSRTSLSKSIKFMDAFLVTVLLSRRL